MLTRTEAGASTSGFDVRIDLVAGWPAVPARGLALEWARRLGPLATQKVLERVVNGEPDLWIGSSALVSTFTAVAVANGLFAPAVEAQRASCRALSQRLGASSLEQSHCLNSTFAVVDGGERALCNPRDLETLPSTTGAKLHNSARSRLSVDIVAFGGGLFKGYTGEAINSREVLICGCIDSDSTRTWLAWALELARKQPMLQNTTVLFRQADCNALVPDTPSDSVTGYGVDLRIKSTEYKATVDDAPAGTAKKAKDAADEEDRDGDGDAVDDDTAGLKALEGVSILGLNLEKLSTRYPSFITAFLAFNEQAEAEGMSEDLARWELADLGLQASGRIRRSLDPLSTLESLTGNFPGMMAALARDKVKAKMRKAVLKLEVSKAHEMFALSGFQPGIELDGQTVADEGLALLPALRMAESKIAGLALMGLGGNKSLGALANLSTGNASAGAVSPQRLDWRDPALLFAYNVRDDPEAEDWPRRLGSVQGMGKTDVAYDPYAAMLGGDAYGSQSSRVVEIKHPVFTIVFVFDPSETAMLKLAVNITSKTRAARVALVPVASSNQMNNASAAAAAAFGWLLKSGKKADATTARAFLQALLTRVDGKSKGAKTASLNLSHVGAALREVKAGGKKGKSKKSSTNADKEAKDESELLLKAISEGDKTAKAFQSYSLKVGLPSPSIAVNGIVILPNWSVDSHGGALESSLKALLKDEEKEIRKISTDKRLKDKKNSKEVDASLEKFFITDRRVATLFDSFLTPSLVFETPLRDDPSVSGASLMELQDLSASPQSKTRVPSEPRTVVLPGDAIAQLPSFLKGGVSTATVDVELVLFITKLDAVALIPAFAESLLGTSGSRLTVVAAPPLDPTGSDVSGRMWSCLRESISLETLSSQKWSPTSGCEAAVTVPASAATGMIQAAANLWSALPLDATGLAASGATIVCNGQLVPDVPLTVPSSTASLVAAHWCPRAPAGVEAHLAAPALAIMPKPRSELFKRCDDLSKTPSSLRVRLPRKDSSTPTSVQVAAEIDPLWEGATAFAAITRLLHAKLNADVCIVLRPKKVIEEYPLKRWSRHVVGWPAAQQARSLASFERLRTKHTLTVAVASPQSWLVTARKSVHDLDNVRQMDAVHGIGPRPEVTATYELERLYIEGSAYSAAGKAVAGLQLELLSPDGSIEDTRVMKNRGFWSMPAVPGRFHLRLKEGPSSETFELVDQDAGGTTASELALEVTSFDVPVVPLTVRTRPGAKDDDLFSKTFGKRKRSWKRRQRKGAGKSASSKPLEESPVSSLLGALNPYNLGQKINEQESGEDLPTVHIFSVASGHLYERLLAIMILSVRRHTSCPLHFWFIDNFLSPEFKEVLLPSLVEKHGGGNVMYDLVTFKWPSWLNPQTEKQRLIWAYKILFLDVLFPMDVPRVIFIDADQVVRADVLELWRMDLRDSVYGFTPFCSGTVQGVDRENNLTTGFRFWEKGYWKSHLGALPYHISALFVVDLEEFRRRSVGDELRSIYNQLTKDPNGLANLDQDLPNFAQLQIPIHSLPQEWLWCESWCSNETKVLAKTIDLCQNPQTKEPKIAMAKRIIPEWEGFHRQVLALGTSGGSSGDGQGTVQEASSGARSARSGEL